MNSDDTFLQPVPVAQATEDVRSRFIVRTYNHLFGAIALFTLIEIVLFKTGIAEKIAVALAGNWLLVLGGFMLVGWFSSRAAATSKSLSSQYLALVAFVAAEAIIFIPLLFTPQNRLMMDQVLAVQNHGFLVMLLSKTRNRLTI